MHILHGQHNHSTTPHTAGRTIQWAHQYDLVVNLMALGQASALRRKSVELAQIKTGDKVLDVGCGTGDLTLAAKARAGEVGEVYGIDASPEMIEVAQHKAAHQGASITFQIDLIEKLSFADKKFDVVLSSLMMHHLPRELKLKGLGEIRRVLKPGGRLVIVDFKHPSTPIELLLAGLLMHGGLQSGIQELPSLMTEVGFTQIESGELQVMMLGFAKGQIG